MLHIDIIRAWKDEEYRNSLSEEQRAQLPENPAGLIELGDTDMESVAGGVEIKSTESLAMSLCCSLVTTLGGCIPNGAATLIKLFGKCRI
jgi:mersacidin/lichenicidin family type 2 lantibiotic